MSIQSSPFSGTILSGEDSEKFVEQFLKKSKPNTQAVEAYKRGKKIMEHMSNERKTLLNTKEEDRLTYLLEDFKNTEEDLIPGSIGAEVMEDYDASDQG